MKNNIEVQQFRFGRRRWICAYCKYFERFSHHLGVCKKYGFEITLEMAKKSRICKDFELHHVMPSGNLAPTKPKRTQNKTN